MQKISIDDLQKNISILTKIDDLLIVVNNKRKNRAVTVVYPVNQSSVVKSLAGKYRDRVRKSNKSLQEIKEQAIMEALRQKYGLSD